MTAAKKKKYRKRSESERPREAKKALIGPHRRPKCFGTGHFAARGAKVEMAVLRYIWTQFSFFCLSRGVETQAFWQSRRPFFGSEQ